MALGGSVSPVADAFLFAFRIPNLFRELFGEGALTASYLPVLTAEMEKDARSAGQLATVVVTLLAATLTVVVALGEVRALDLAGLGRPAGRGSADGALGRDAALPLVRLHCRPVEHDALRGPALYLARVRAGRAEHRLADRRLPGGPRLTANKPAQAYVLAAGVMVAGILQVLAQLPTLRRLGFRFDYHWPAAREGAHAGHSQHGADDRRPGGHANQYLCRA